MAARSDVWLNLKVGSNIALLNGIVRVILDNGWENKEFIAKRTENLEELKAKVAEYDLARVESYNFV